MSATIESVKANTDARSLDLPEFCCGYEVLSFRCNIEQCLFVLIIMIVSRAAVYMVNSLRPVICKKWRTCIVHHDNRAGLANCLQDGERTDSFQSSTSSIAEHCCLFSDVNIKVLLHIVALTQGGIKTQILIRIQSRVAARQNYIQPCL
jgi:hypothetical protein